jgi:ArsR family transcriptional regulator, arsenate/arsenite/antimonite-responsive transcriptional repressor
MKVQLVFEALADENRRKILGQLKQRSMAVNEILAHLPITGASLSHHLNKLKAADLVSSRREGQTIIYSVNTSVFEDFAAAAAQFFGKGNNDE